MEYWRVVVLVGMYVMVICVVFGKGVFFFRLGDWLLLCGELDNVVFVLVCELNIDVVSGCCVLVWCKNVNMINSGDYFVVVM